MIFGVIMEDFAVFKHLNTITTKFLINGQTYRQTSERTNKVTPLSVNLPTCVLSNLYVYPFEVDEKLILTQKGGNR